MERGGVRGYHVLAAGVGFLTRGEERGGVPLVKTRMKADGAQSLTKVISWWRCAVTEPVA